MAPSKGNAHSFISCDEENNHRNRGSVQGRLLTIEVGDSAAADGDDGVGLLLQPAAQLLCCSPPQCDPHRLQAAQTKEDSWVPS